MRHNGQPKHLSEQVAKAPFTDSTNNLTQLVALIKECFAACRIHCEVVGMQNIPSVLVVVVDGICAGPSRQERYTLTLSCSSA